jgi:DNA-binding transcriptional regulator YdaS (Cro superfamily)
MDPGIRKAIEAAGGRSADLAKLLGISPSAISQWARVPYRRALQIEARTQGRVTRQELRPEVFGEPLPAKGGGTTEVGLERFAPRVPR